MIALPDGDGVAARRRRRFGIDGHDGYQCPRTGRGEIGVLRAIGASNGAVMQNVLVEGVLIGWLSWALGMLGAMPLSALLADAVGVAFMQEPLRHTFSVTGAALWLGIIHADRHAGQLSARAQGRPPHDSRGPRIQNRPGTVCIFCPVSVL